MTAADGLPAALAGGLGALCAPEVPAPVRSLWATAGLEGARLEHVRFKPGVSVVARVRNDDAPWWFAGFAPQARAKADKIRLRACEAGAAVTSAEVPDGSLAGHTLLAGPIAADKQLVKRLTRVGIAADGVLAGDVLSYNPFRRLVLRTQGAVARVWAEPPATAKLLAAVYDAGAPVLPVEPLGKHGVVQPWAGSQVLTGVLHRGDESALAEVGAGLARLHRADVAGRQGVPLIDVARGLGAVRSTLEAVAPQHLLAFDAVAVQAHTRQASSRGEVLLHGDFSADQVVLGADGPVLIDLDRLKRGPAGYDLGAFAAVELLEGRHPAAVESVLAGLRAGGGALLDVGEVSVWAAVHVLLRAAEPFRALRAGWPAEVAGRIEMARGLLGGRFL